MEHGEYDDFTVGNERIEEYRNSGDFQKETMDLLPRILADILKVPIVVITSAVSKILFIKNKIGSSMTGTSLYCVQAVCDTNINYRIYLTFR